MHTQDDNQTLVHQHNTDDGTTRKDSKVTTHKDIKMTTCTDLKMIQQVKYIQMTTHNDYDDNKQDDQDDI